VVVSHPALRRRRGGGAWPSALGGRPRRFGAGGASGAVAGRSASCTGAARIDGAGVAAAASGAAPSCAALADPLLGRRTIVPSTSSASRSPPLSRPSRLQKLSGSESHPWWW